MLSVWDCFWDHFATEVYFAASVILITYKFFSIVLGKYRLISHLNTIKLLFLFPFFTMWLGSKLLYNNSLHVKLLTGMADAG